jgi:hypothetical protein
MGRVQEGPQYGKKLLYGDILKHLHNNQRARKIIIIMLGSYIALYHGSKAVSKRFTIYITLTLLPQQT